MKKIFTVCCVVCLLLGSSFPARAQDAPTDPIEVGTWMVNADIGLGGHIYGGSRMLYGFGFKIAAQKGLWQAGPGVISLGAEAGMGLASYEGMNFSRLNVALRSNFHYGWEVPGLDTYGGISMGLGFATHSNQLGNNVFLYGDLHVGVSYFFLENFAVNAEIGVGSMQFMIGFAYRF
ncbi:MAG: hypothetical protein FWH23_05775 [Bacteroidales bacterium]|nr:hypothetical protein [Bacteroidales bacterium]